MASLDNLTFASEDQRTLAQFGAAALDYDLEKAPPDLIEASDAMS